MIKIRYDENLEKYSININDHAAFNFENSDELINDFMLVFEQKFVPRDGSLFKCSFTIVNSQPPPEIGDSRTWTTSVYQGGFFN